MNLSVFITVMIILIVAMLVGIILYAFAKSKNKANASNWFYAGFIGVLIAGIAAMFATKKK